MVNPVNVILYFVFPGLSAIRAISRMGGLIPLGVGIAAAISFCLLRSKITSQSLKRVFPVIVLLLLLLESFPTKGIRKPYRAEKPPVPKEYVWLKNIAEDGPILEWPIICFICEADYLKWSIYHENSIVNGYASWQWDGHKKLSQMKDFSTPESLRAIYAFGVRYLLVHKKGSSFPIWAGKQIGKFQLVQKFDNALVYINTTSAPQFLPQAFREKFHMALQPTGQNSWNLSLKFTSPEKYFIQTKKRTFPVELNWQDGIKQTIRLTLFPTLWRHGDTINRIIKQEGMGAPKLH